MTRLLVSASILGLSMALPATAATITDWNTDNVQVGATPPDGITGESVVYDQSVPPIGTASTSGKIVFTPPEAGSPGIKVVNSAYPDTGKSSTLTLDGCIMASSTATCDSPFQSGKRIKQVVTGFDPVDLVFDIDDTSTTESVYQVFGRLINQTSKSLAGFSLELGFGVGNDFVQATAADGISFSTLFTAQPSGSGPVSTQFPFGLFGDADTNPNFLLDGFFADERTGFDTTVTTAKIESSAIYGPYSSIFGDWMSAGLEPQGLFWDFDQDPDTDALLMAKHIADRNDIDANRIGLIGHQRRHLRLQRRLLRLAVHFLQIGCCS